MGKSNRPPEYAEVGDKNIWHIYSLQSLSGKRFIDTVNKILSNKYDLVNCRNNRKLT